MSHSIRQLREAARKQLLERWQGEDTFLEQSRANVALDVDVLLSFVTGLDKVGLLTQRDRMVEAGLAAQFQALLNRRSLHEPVAYLTGEREFYGRSFAVSPAVLVPRPETELLVERSLAVLVELLTEGEGKLLFVDVGTGSGAILLSTVLELVTTVDAAAFARLIAVGIDLSAAALEVANCNRQRLAGALSNVALVQGDLLGGLGELSEFDALVIVSNPPYIELGAVLPTDVVRFEPSMALFGGESGLDVVAELIKQSFRRLSQIRGALLFEIGSGQADKVVSLLPERPPKECQLLEDLQGVRRVCAVRVGPPSSD